MAAKTSCKPESRTRGEKSNWQKSLILIGGTYNSFVSLGTLLSINTLYVELLDVFQTTRRETSFVQTTFFGITFASGLIAGIIVRRLGIKTCLTAGAFLASLGFFLAWFATSVPYLIAVIGIISGLGNSLIFISSIVLVAETFNAKRSLAMAIFVFGPGLGQIVIPLLLGKLLDVYGLRGCLLVISGLYLNIIVSCLLSTSSLGANLSFRMQQKENIQGSEAKTGHWKSLVKPVFLLFVITSTLSVAISANVVVLFMDYMDNQGLSLQTGINVFIGFSTLGLVTRLGAGAATLSRHVHSFVLFCFFSLLFGSGLLLLKAVTSFTSNVILLCLMGGANGGIIGLVNIVPIDLCGVENSGLAVGINTMGIGLITPVMGVLIGWVFDSTKSYSLAFDIFGGVATGSALFALILYCVRTYVKRRKRDTDTQA